MADNITKSGPPDEYLRAMGLLTISWAGVEDIIDALCFASFAFFDGKAEFPHDPLPRSLDRQVTYLRKCFTRLPALAGWQAEMKPLLDEVRRLKLERHRLVHGVPLRYEPNGIISLIKWRYETEHFTTARSTTSTPEIGSLAKEVIRLTRPLMDVALGVCYKMNPDFFDKPPAEISRQLSGGSPILKRIGNAARKHIARVFSHRPSVPSL